MYFKALVLTATLLALAPAIAHADGYLVELESPPTVEGTDPSTLSAERTRFRDAARASDITYKQRFAYSTLFNGVSVSAGDDAAAELRHLDGVVAVHPVTTATLQQDAFEPTMAFASAMTGADIARSRLGYTGRGIHVAVMDSGIDYHHPDLGGCFGPGCRVSNGYDFVGDDYDAEESNALWQPVPHPDADPDDNCNGHGTHVAGIVGARGAVTGVAPDVTFGAYRVFGCHGATSTDVMLAAMERIYRDGADVLNLSITEVRSSWPDSPTAKAASRLVEKGVVVVAGAGNNHGDGLWGAGAPGVGEDVIAVASVDNLQSSRAAFSLSPDDLPIAFRGAGSVLPPLSGTFELARTGTVTTPDDACQPLADRSLEGKVALVRRGTCPFTLKGANVVAAGAVGLVFYNNIPDFDGLPFAGGVQIPVVYITQAEGQLVNDRLDQGPVTLTWGAVAAEPVPTAGLLSNFSTVGLAADLSLKPDIAAPGGQIWSTVPVELGSYATGSGTSMSSPHVAGAAALFLQAHPQVRARDVGAWLMNSADPVAAAGSPGLLDHVARQGAGLLDIDDAIQATTVITPGKLSLGDDQPRPQTVTLVNTGPQPVTYALSHAPALAIAGREPAAEHAEGAPAGVAFSQDGRPVTAVTVRPFGRTRLDVRVTPSPALSEGALYGGYLVFVPTVGERPLRVPYAGYKGDYQAVPATTPTAQGFPWLARATQLSLLLNGTLQPAYVKQSAGATFTMRPTTLTLGPFTRASVDRPVLLVHFNHPARRVRVELYSARHRTRLGEALALDFVARNPVENAVLPPALLATALPLDGTTRLGHRSHPIPDGDYYAVMTVERALAGRRTPKETWTSPVFRIQRPETSRAAGSAPGRRSGPGFR
jgi:subtilisin family serine protease